MVTISHEGPTPPAAPAAGLARRRTRRRLAFWLFLSVVVAVSAVAGLLTWRIVSTFDALHSRSTPPPIVSGAVLGGSPEVQIDSGPALTSVASAGEPTVVPTDVAPPAESTTPTPTAQPTRSNEPTRIVIELFGTSTPAPRATRTPAGEAETPADEPTATPPPEPTPTPFQPVLSEIERVENGSFEDGVAAWYVEDGAGAAQIPDAVDGQSVLRIPAAGAYADQRIFYVPGTTYVLSGWGRVSAGGDAGLLGVIYQDAEQNRLPELEPAPIEFTETAMTGSELEFTPPAEVASINIYIYKEAGSASLDVDLISVRSVVQPFVEGDSVTVGPELADGALTIVLMGVDAREGEAIDGEVRPDSLMVVHLNPGADSCRVLAIPRDTRTELPGYGQSKIAHALALGGIAYQEQVVSNLIGLPIDHYVLIDFNGFEDLVDAVGGIEVDVPVAFTAIDTTSFAAGMQAMNGKQALSYARHRGGADGDFGRIQRQQQIIRALIREGSELEVLASLNELLPAVGENLRTDLAIGEMAEIASTYRSICTEDAVSMIRLEGEVAVLDDPLLGMPLSYVIVDEAEVRRKVAMLLEA